MLSCSRPRRLRPRRRWQTKMQQTHLQQHFCHLLILAIAQAFFASSSFSFSFSTPIEKPIIKEPTRPRIPVITYQDDWVCVNKPAGISVYRSGGSRTHRFVLSTLLKRQLARKVFPVHRLDHRTSGAILFAFNSRTCSMLHSSLRSNEATKQYIALLRGDWRVNHGDVTSIDKPLMVDGVLKEARTEFTLLASIPGSEDQRQIGEPGYIPACSLVQVEPKTGRMHQIRRHAYALGHPVLGDTQHGDTKVNRWWRTNRGLDRLALHCLSLDLPPLMDDDGKTLTQGRIKCVAPLSPELTAVLKSDDLKELWNKAIQKESRLALDPVDERGGSLGRRKRNLIRSEVSDVG